MREEVLYEVFQDLRKAYNTLDHEIYLDIIITYGVGLWTERLLRRYWEGLTVVSRAGI